MSQGADMDPIFTTFEHGGSSYVLERTGRASCLEEYAQRKDEWRCELTEHPNMRCFIPCPCCNDTATTFTFRFSSEEGTNTSGGTEYTDYEVHCGSCGTFSMFTRTETHGPGD